MGTNDMSRREKMLGNKNRIGKKHSEEAKIKIGLGRLGKKHSQATKDKIRAALSGDKAPNWKGGISLCKLRVQEERAGRKRPENCEICDTNAPRRRSGAICFDHDHKTGKFRGWICQRCNSVLGMVRDDAELLVRLSKYLSG